MRHIALVPLALCLTLVAAEANAVTLRGSFTYRGNKRGLRLRASGPLKLRINEHAGTFTCFCSGNSTVVGNTRIEGHKVHVKGRSRVNATRCSGRIVDGRLRGKLRFTHKGKATYTVKVPVGGVLRTKRKVMRINKPFIAKIDGLVSLNSGGSGTIVDDEREVWQWRVSAAGQRIEEPRRAMDPPPPKPTKRKLTGKTPEQHRADEARRRNQKAAEKSRQQTERRDKKHRKKRRNQAKRKEQRKLGDRLKDAASPAEKKKIVKDFLSNKKRKTDKKVSKLDRRLKDAKDKRDFNKELDKSANQLGDDIKGKLDEGKKKIVDQMQKKGWGWVKKNSKTARKLDRGAKRLSDSKLGKGAKFAGKVKEKFDKAKEVYDEVKKVKKTIDGINAKVKSGAISKGRGKVLKGGTILGKALSKVTAFVPVVGKAASKVTDMTFAAALKIGNLLSTYYTTTDCCTDRPEADCCG
ncbi:MAG: hypothetical protein KC502_09930 [Myxococcales bacterium]|nr:hypothetical protein [Myxococcales bacterium]